MRRVLTVIVLLVCVLPLGIMGCSKKELPDKSRLAKQTPDVLWKSEGKGGSTSNTFFYSTADGQQYLLTEHALWLMKGGTVSLVYSWAGESDESDQEPSSANVWPGLDSGLYIQTDKALHYVEGTKVVQVTVGTIRAKPEKKLEVSQMSPKEKLLWSKLVEEYYKSGYLGLELERAHNKGYKYSWEEDS